MLVTSRLLGVREVDRWALCSTRQTKARGQPYWAIQLTQKRVVVAESSDSTASACTHLLVESTPTMMKRARLGVVGYGPMLSRLSASTLLC
ncbi:hypothetical protein OEZ86_001471 [Tetradesmus obliquus]|uniref:Uncharacterized protein n=1 Tax=Tetradesmus obliquus TaxID=3088 RepID=A0ABY8UR19_TETOB|nr:hypothetical protein OEZ85_013541 [Tetradesmus obliquus]WIA33880.1 hypothetical protein OEZ86_006980 [Tetradesmus obliquus]WIA38109.1 hypothetical protein OEZ86_001471 [Tetradesmus obliquus]